MSQVKRWGTPYWREWNKPNDRGMYVLYADHVAALLTQDRQHGEQSHGHCMDGYAAGLAAAREALELLPVSLVDTRFDPDDDRRYVQAVRLTSALAAIDALRGGE